ncbi:MAG: hypothetical protein IJB82_05205 [Bacilli bacterium]|nr:hypothetical protein [Bacilli bacterium]
MKKIIFRIIFFLVLFLFLNLKSNETEDFISINYYNEKIGTQKYFTLKLYDFNILDLELFTEDNTQIISIIPKENIYNVNNISFDNKSMQTIIKTSINDYKNKLLNNNYEEEAIYIENKGFLISKMKILSTYEDLLKLENKINFKIIYT